MPKTFDDQPARFQPTPVFREKRKPQLVKVELSDAAGAIHEVLVRDISARGISAAARGDPPAANEIVSVRLPDGQEYWGLVRWVDGNLFGVEFQMDGGETHPAARSAAPPSGAATRIRKLLPRS